MEFFLHRLNKNIYSFRYRTKYPILHFWNVHQSFTAKALGITKGGKNMSENLTHDFNETHVVEKLKAYISEKSAEVQKV